MMFISVDRDSVDVACTSIGKIINELTNKMMETMKAKVSHYFNHIGKNVSLHETNSSLRFIESTVSLYDNFESSIRSRFDLHDNMSFANLEQENDLKLAHLGMSLRTT